MNPPELQTIEDKTNSSELVKVASDFVNVATKVADIYANSSQNKFELQKQKQTDYRILEEQKIKLEEQEQKFKNSDNCHAKLFLVGCVALMVVLGIFGKLDAATAFALGLIAGANINKAPQTLRNLMSKFFSNT